MLWEHRKVEAIKEMIKEYWFQQPVLFRDTHNSAQSVASQV